MRVVVFNHLRNGYKPLPGPRPSLPKTGSGVRATDKASCSCGCGGTCNHAHDRVSAVVSVDVKYTRGDQEERRHYTVKGFPVAIDGNAPAPDLVRKYVDLVPSHRDMLRDGWKTSKVEGYYERDNANVRGKVLLK